MGEGLAGRALIHLSVAAAEGSWISFARSRRDRARGSFATKSHSSPDLLFCGPFVSSLSLSASSTQSSNRQISNPSTDIRVPSQSSRMGTSLYC